MSELIYDKENFRLKCCKEQPYNSKLGKFWFHPEAKDLGNDNWDENIKYKCPICGLEFKTELPD